MPAFNSSQAYRDATSTLQQLGPYAFEQYRAALDEARRQGIPADWAQEWATNYYLNRADNGFGSPEDIRGIGQRVMPGVDDYIGTSRDRLNRIGDSYNTDVVGPGNIIGNRYDQLNAQAGDIGRLGESTQGEIDSTYGRAADRNAAAGEAITGDLRDRYNGLASGTNDTFGGMRRANRGTADDLASDNAGTTVDMIRRAEGDYSAMRGNSAALGRQQEGDIRRTIGGLQGQSDAGYRNLDRMTGSAYGATRSDLGSTISGLEGQRRAGVADLRQGLDRTIGGLEGRTGEVYTGLGDSADGLYGTSLDETEMLRPAGEAETARVGRNFAPVLANARGRLRRMGIGPDSLQYMAQMSDIEGDRARAMDDASAQSTRDYVGRRSDIRDRLQGSRERLGQNQLGTEIDLGMAGQAGRERLGNNLMDNLDRLSMTRYSEGRDLNMGELGQRTSNFLNEDQNRQRLGIAGLDRTTDAQNSAIGRDLQLGDRQITNTQNLQGNRLDRNQNIQEGALGREISLGTGQNDRVSSLSREQGDLYRGEVDRRNATDTGLDYSRSNQTIANSRDQYGMTSDWRDRMGSADLMSRDLTMQDWATRGNLAREQNANDLSAIDLRNAQYDQGRQYQIDDRTTRDTGAAAVMGIGNQARNNQFRFGEQARGYGQDAYRGYADTANRQAGAGNWGWGLIGGGLQMAAPFLNAIPGVGPVLSGIASQAGGMMGNRTAAVQGQGGQGGYGGFGGQSGGGIFGTPPFVPQYQQRGTPIRTTQQAQGAGYYQPGTNPIGYGIPGVDNADIRRNPQWSWQSMG